MIVLLSVAGGIIILPCWFQSWCSTLWWQSRGARLNVAIYFRYSTSARVSRPCLWCSRNWRHSSRIWSTVWRRTRCQATEVLSVDHTELPLRPPTPPPWTTWMTRGPHRATAVWAADPHRWNVDWVLSDTNEDGVPSGNQNSAVLRVWIVSQTECIGKYDESSMLGHSR